MNPRIHTDRAPAAIGPYSQGVWAGDTLWLSGQLGLDAQTGLLPEGTRAQARLAFANVKALLTSQGLDFGDVVKLTIFITDLEDFAAVNDEMVAAFEGFAYPARSCVAVADLPKHGLVEIEAVAHRQR